MFIEAVRSFLRTSVLCRDILGHFMIPKFHNDGQIGLGLKRHARGIGAKLFNCRT